MQNGNLFYYRQPAVNCIQDRLQDDLAKQNQTVPDVGMHGHEQRLLHIDVCRAIHCPLNHQYDEKAAVKPKNWLKCADECRSIDPF